jgi:hypothetical protein
MSKVPRSTDSGIVALLEAITMSHTKQLIELQISSLRQRAALLTVAIKALEQLKRKPVKPKAA